MAVARPETVLGDFDDARFEHFAERYRFEREGDGYRVEVDGESHEIAFTFGFDPLQQYLVAAPRGRLQVLGAAWDARPAAQGGQRWFHLHPDEPVPRSDVLHWEGLAGRWNSQCAECHSTHLLRGYQPAQDAYATRWSDLDVACEACHGPGSRHVAWAEDGASEAADRGLAVDLTGGAHWAFVAGEAIARRTGEPSAREIGTCAPCHSRRSRLVEAPEPGRPFLDGYRPALLEPGLYFADGQIEGEVYVWGSFLQSRMFAAGVVCSDCHEPHGLRIPAPDAACAKCHRPEVFAVPTHHHHAPDSPGASCVACHMPARTYMGVDVRHDHGFRVPRPELSEAIGAPNTCTGCHGGRSAGWAAEALAGWNGPRSPGPSDPAVVLNAGRHRLPGAGAALARLGQDSQRPAIVRASALALLGAQLDPTTAPAVHRSLVARDGLVRLAAVAAAGALPARERFEAVAPRLADPLRAVRVDAAHVALTVPAELRRPEPRLAPALAEYRAAQVATADHPESQVNLGDLELRLGHPAAARRAYERAVAFAPQFVPAYVERADLERRMGDEPAAERVLRAGLAAVPDSADLHHALGLLEVRAGRHAEAREELARAHALAPNDARYAYVYGIALHSAGDEEAALRVLEEAHRAHPGDAAVLRALVALHRDRGEIEAALRYEAALRASSPPAP